MEQDYPRHKLGGWLGGTHKKTGNPGFNIGGHVAHLFRHYISSILQSPVRHHKPHTALIRTIQLKILIKMASPSLSLFRGFPSSPSYVWSPFATKLEARLRFAGFAYKTEQGAPPKAPRGKIPYLAISKAGDAAPETVSDTALISEKLISDGLAKDLNGKLTAAEKAQDLAVRALLEDKLYFYQVNLSFLVLLSHLGCPNAPPHVPLKANSYFPCEFQG